MPMNKKHLRILLLCLAAALILIPLAIVGITGNGFGELVSHLLVSASLLSVIAATLLDLDRKNQNKFFLKMGITIGLLIVLVSIWL